MGNIAKKQSHPHLPPRPTSEGSTEERPSTKNASGANLSFYNHAACGRSSSISPQFTRFLQRFARAANPVAPFISLRSDPELGPALGRHPCCSVGLRPIHLAGGFDRHFKDFPGDLISFSLQPIVRAARSIQATKYIPRFKAAARCGEVGNKAPRETSAIREHLPRSLLNSSQGQPLKPRHLTIPGRSRELLRPLFLTPRGQPGPSEDSQVMGTSVSVTLQWLRCTSRHGLYGAPRISGAGAGRAGGANRQLEPRPSPWVASLPPPGISSRKPRARMALGWLSPAPTFCLAAQTRTCAHLGSCLTTSAVAPTRHYLLPPVQPSSSSHPSQNQELRIRLHTAEK